MEKSPSRWLSSVGCCDGISQQKPLLIPDSNTGQWQQQGAKDQEWGHSACTSVPSLSQISQLLSCTPSPEHKLSRSLTHLPFLTSPLQLSSPAGPQVPKATSFFLTSLSSSLAQSLCVSGSSCQEHAFLSFCMAESSLFLALSSICNFLSWACHSVLCHSVLFTALSISKINLSFSFLDHHLFAPSRTKLSKGRLLTGICYADDNSHLHSHLLDVELMTTRATIDWALTWC